MYGLRDNDDTFVARREDLWRPMESGKRKKASSDGASPLSDGVYSLDPPPQRDAVVQYVRGALSYTRAEFEDLWTVSDGIPRTVNQWGNENRRLQATYGASYAFSGQSSHRVETPLEEEWPVIVQRALQDARRRAAPDVAQQLNGAHVNWYSEGRAGIDPHSDDERSLVRGAPIFSYTLLATPGTPRPFDILEADGKTIVARVNLDAGDMLVMAGDMQSRYKHGMRRTAAAAFATHRRINITIRAFNRTATGEASRSAQ